MIRPKITLALSVYDRHIPFFDGTVALKDAELQVLAVGRQTRSATVASVITGY
jgi:hypothetical protein